MDNQKMGFAVVYVLCMIGAAGLVGLTHSPRQVISLQVIAPENQKGYDVPVINPIYRPAPDDLRQAEPCQIAAFPGDFFRGFF